MEPQFSKKSLYLLRENIRTLLHARREDQKTLAEWCGHQKSWLNKFLNEGRGIRVGDFDRIASFFGIEVYQLFQPGITLLTERRVSNDRRSGADRRVGHAVRMLPGLRAELNKVPRMASRGADYATVGSVPPAIAAIVAKAEQEIARYYEATTREQTANPRQKIAGASKRRRALRGSDPETA